MDLGAEPKSDTLKTPVDGIVTHSYAELSSVRLHYAEAGQGPLVILLHGFPEFWYTWRHQIPALAAAGHRVVAPDMRGYGLSGKPKGTRSYRMERLTADVEELIRHLGAERADLVGHDWGGAVAWSFAIRYPERLRSLVILNVPHPQRFIAALRSPRQLLMSWYVFFFQLPWLPEATMRAGAFALVRRMYRAEPSRPGAYAADDIERHIEAMARPGALTAMVNYYRAALAESVVQRQVAWPRIEAPVLVLWGDRDRYLGSELAEPRRDLVPDVHVEHFPGASHWLQQDMPDDVNERLVRFLSAPMPTSGEARPSVEGTSVDGGRSRSDNAAL